LSIHRIPEKQAVSSDSFGKYSISVNEIFIFSLEKQKGGVSSPCNLGSAGIRL
jgi:hypothetical protein